MDQSFVNTIEHIKQNLRDNSTYIIVIGVTLHMMTLSRYKSGKGLKHFRHYLSKAKEDLKDIAKETTVLWFLQAQISVSILSTNAPSSSKNRVKTLSRQLGMPDRVSRQNFSKTEHL
ncbi:UNVERIFIED_CONTAM: hypothetical protein RMT77_005023 [Armadillidium vulgare]